MRVAPAWMRCWLLLCSDLALRSGTAAKMGPENYDRERRVLTFKTKFGRSQVLPVTRELEAMLSPLTQPGVPFVSQLSRLGRISARYARNAFAKARRAAGITRKLTAHDFRRATAVHVYDHSRDLRLVQAVLGHNNLATTLYYLDHRDVQVDVTTLELAKLNPITETPQ